MQYVLACPDSDAEQQLTLAFAFNKIVAATDKIHRLAL
jgi:hypothetical protein